MKIIIREEKYDELTKCAEKMLRYGGKLMSCLEEMGDSYSERNDEDWDDEDDDERSHYRNGGRGGMHMRQGVRGTGPYSRYRY